MRVFIAVDLPYEAKEELAKLQKRLKKQHWPVRWEKPEKIHLTLAFLGEFQERRLPQLKTLVKKACLGVKPFEISFKGLGAFPDFFKPRIVWLGLKGDLKTLAQLQKSIARELKKTGFWFDKKPFVPHMTLGRVKRGVSKGALQDLGKKIGQKRILSFQNTLLVDSIKIMKSNLLPEGSVYQELAKIKFF